MPGIHRCLILEPVLRSVRQRRPAKHRISDGPDETAIVAVALAVAPPVLASREAGIEHQPIRYWRRPRYLVEPLRLDVADTLHLWRNRRVGKSIGCSCARTRSTDRLLVVEDAEPVFPRRQRRHTHSDVFPRAIRVDRA